MPWDRMEAAGYVFIPPSGSSENLASYGTKPAVPDPTEATAMLHEILFVDTDYPDRGHRTNMVDPDLKELGTGIAAGVYDTFNTVMGTENFAYSAGRRSGRWGPSGRCRSPCYWRPPPEGCPRIVRRSGG